jgi:hypothetical protein
MRGDARPFGIAADDHFESRHSVPTTCCDGGVQRLSAGYGVTLSLYSKYRKSALMALPETSNAAIPTNAPVNE